MNIRNNILQRILDEVPIDLKMIIFDDQRHA